jgi:hypothetical protein
MRLVKKRRKCICFTLSDYLSVRKDFAMNHFLLQSLLEAINKILT